MTSGCHSVYRIIQTIPIDKVQTLNQRPISYFHRQLISVLDAAREPSDLKLIVAPTSKTAASIRTAAARYGRPLVNIEALTPNAVAFHIWKTDSPAEASRFVSGQVMQLVLGSSLSELDDVESRLFARSIPTTVQAILEDRIAGHDALWAERNAQSATQRIYASLFRVYEKYLYDHARLDQAAVLHRAIELAPRFKSERHLGTLLVCNEVQLSAAQATLLEELASGLDTALLLGEEDSQWPDDHASNVLSQWRYAGSEAQTATSENRSSVHLTRVLQASTRREEVMLVLQDILERKIPFGDVELGYTNESSYPVIISSLCSRLSIPSSLNKKDDSKRVVEFLRGYCRWIDSGYSAEPLIQLMRTGLLRSEVDSVELATVYQQFSISLSALENPDLRAVLIEGARVGRIPFPLIDSLLEMLREFKRNQIPERITPSEMKLHMSTFCKRFFAHNEIAHNENGTDPQSVIDALFSDYEDVDLPANSSRWLSEKMLQRLVGSELSSDGGQGLLVSSISDVGYGPRSYCYVLGLDDKASGGTDDQTEDHFAGLPVERSSTSRVRVRPRVAELSRRFGERLTLAVSSYDVGEGRSLYPGSPILELSAIKELDPAPRSEFVDAADQFRMRPTKEAVAHFDEISSGLEAEGQRLSSSWTSYDGMVGADLAASKDPIRLSPSRVEVLAGCPHRYFLGEILKIPVAPEAQDDWISKADEGTILHALFERHGQARIDGNAGIETKDEQAILEELGESLSRQAIRSGSDLRAVIEQKTDELASGVRQYFRRERELEGVRKPVAVEFPFADRTDASIKHVTIELASGTVFLTGRIDRIDETNDGKWIVIDYKSGGYSEFHPKKLKALDDKLQWALYSLAAGRISGKSVESAEYMFTSRKGAGWVSSVAAPSEEEILPGLESLVARIQSGAFVQAADPRGPCKWCDFKPVCGDLAERKQSVTRKFEESSDPLKKLYDSWRHFPKSAKS